jgi:hypothetical protein
MSVWSEYELQDRGEYDRDNDRIICEFCDWYDTGGSAACGWAYSDHLDAEHPETNC